MSCQRRALKHPRETEHHSWTPAQSRAIWLEAALGEPSWVLCSQTTYLVIPRAKIRFSSQCRGPDTYPTGLRSGTYCPHVLDGSNKSSLESVFLCTIVHSHQPLPRRGLWKLFLLGEWVVSLTMYVREEGSGQSPPTSLLSILTTGVTGSS